MLNAARHSIEAVRSLQRMGDYRRVLGPTWSATSGRETKLGSDIRRQGLQSDATDLAGTAALWPWSAHASLSLAPNSCHGTMQHSSVATCCAQTSPCTPCPPAPVRSALLSVLPSCPFCPPVRSALLSVHCTFRSSHSIILIRGPISLIPVRAEDCTYTRDHNSKA